MSLFATIVLAYFFVRYAAFTVEAWRDGRAVMAILTALLALSLFIPAMAVWS